MTELCRLCPRLRHPTLPLGPEDEGSPSAKHKELEYISSRFDKAVCTIALGYSKSISVNPVAECLLESKANHSEHCSGRQASLLDRNMIAL